MTLYLQPCNFHRYLDVRAECITTGLIRTTNMIQNAVERV